MRKQPNRRRKIFIDELQYRLLAVNVSYFFAVLLIFVVALFVPLIVQLLSPATSLWTREVVSTQFLYLNDTIWLPVLLTFFALGAHSVLVSHRIVGPLYHFRRVLGMVAEGDLTRRAVLRDKDYLRKEETAVNEMVEALGVRIEEIEDRADTLQGHVGRLRAAVDAGLEAEIRAELERLDQAGERLRTALGQFKTRGDEMTAATEPVVVGAS